MAPRAPLFLAPIPPVRAQPGYLAAALERGWREDGRQLRLGPARLLITADGFADCAHRADLALAQAGTGTEQVAGLGKPVVTFPGAGPQFVHRFAEAQSRLLGPLIRYLPGGRNIGDALAGLLTDGRQEQRLAAARERLGTAGASMRIARMISDLIR